MVTDLIQQNKHERFVYNVSLQECKTKTFPAQ